MLSAKRIFPQTIRSYPILITLGFLLCSLFVTPGRLYAQGAPTVTYNASIKTVFIGASTGAAPGSQVITLSELATALTNLGSPDVLVNQGGNIWLSKAKIEVDATAKLEVTQAAGVAELRLESIIGNPVYIRAKQGGYLLFNGVKVTSWDTTNNLVDENLADGRAYIVAEAGARMDVIGSELAYLGSALDTSASGVTWLKRLSSIDPATGSTGNVEDSKFHHNYQGLLVSEAYNLKILRNEIHSNLNHGVFVRDGAQLIELGANNVHDNGNKGIGTGDGIVLYNNATQNNLHNNQVTANARHGISLERNVTNNTLTANDVSQNADGIAIAESDSNLVQGNYAHNNRNGIRISGAITDPAANNQLIGNTIEDSVSATSNAYGIYLYGHADSNLLRNNTILRSATYGIYIKSGGNRLEGNVIRDGKTGIAIIGEAESIGQIPLLFASGSRNIVISSTVAANSDIGIRIEGGVANGIGADPQTGTRLAGNVIEGNAGNGVFIKSTSLGLVSTDNLLVGNTIRVNGGSGVVVRDAGTDRNRISQNSITGNAGSGIKIDAGAQQNILAPVITSILADGQVLGTAGANATIEIYSDPGSEGETLLGTATTDGAGAWTFQLPAGQDQKRVTAIVIDASGNTSAFSAASGSSVELFTSVAVDEQNQTVINVNGAGATATLADVQTLLGAANASLLQNLGNGVWRLNANLKLEREVVLNISPDSGVNELQLRSAASTISGTVDYSGFVYIRTHDGTINIDGVKIYGWDTAANKVDDTIGDGRAFIIAKYGATLNISNSELSYLGTPANSESYGVTWRDAATSNPAEVAASSFTRAQVSGQVVNSKFHHNFVGAHVMQGGDMTFTNNEFHDNLNYGFYAHDNSRDIVLEGNLAYNNASHGILLARGCTNFVLRNNKAYTNGIGFAHGIVISQGSAPTAASVENLLEGNEAYGNRGYGINIEGSNNNEVRNNNLHDNQTGLTLEDGSTQNNIHDNTLQTNTSYGLQIRLGSNNNRISNNIATQNASYGFYVRADGNTLSGNQATSNRNVGINVKPENATPLQNNKFISNTVSSNTGSGIDIRGAINSEVSQNVIESNTVHGLYLTDGAVGTTVNVNIIRANTENGIRVNTLLSYQNRWSANSIYDNSLGGINISTGANNSILKPKIRKIEGRFVSGSANTPNAKVEIFTDGNSQGRYFLGSTTADAEGNFLLMISGSFVAPGAVAVATDTQGNSSEFSDTFIVTDLDPDYLLFLPTVTR